MRILETVGVKMTLAISATALTVALITAVSVVQTQFLREDLRSGVAAQQSTLVTRVAEELDGKLDSGLQALSQLASSMPDAVINDADLFRSSPSNSAMLALFDDLLLVGLDGQVKSDYPFVAGRTDLNVSDRAYFRQAITSGPLISEPLRGKRQNEPIVVMAAPILSKDGQVRAVLLGSIRLLRDNYLGNLSSMVVGKSGYLFVLSGGMKPVYVAHPDKSRILQERPANASQETTRALALGYEGTVESTNSTGLRALFSYHRVKSTGWMVASALPTAEAFAPIEQVERRTYSVALVTALLMAPLVWFAALKLFSPLTLLIGRIDGMRRPDAPRAAVRGRSRNEFSILSQAFENLMEERAAAEARVHQSEIHIRAITDNLPALVCYIDHEHRFTFNNRSYEQWLQKPLSEITGRTLSEVYGPSVYAGLRAELEKALAGEPARFEVDFPGRDGRTHYAHGKYRPDVDASGRVKGVYGLITDVTKLKEAEGRLLEERSRIANILDGTNAGTWEWNVQTGEIRVNERWAEIIGYTLEELGPTTIDLWLEHTHPEDVKLSRKKLQKDFESCAEHSEYEARMRHKSGEWMWVHAFGRVSARDAEGRPIWMHGVSLDVTARKRSEEALRRSQEFMERTGQVAGVGGWELDLASGAVIWSDETCRLHDVEPGYRPDLARALDFYAPHSRSIIEEAVHQAMEFGTPWDLELELRSARGRVFWARAVGTAQFENGKPIRLVGAFQDVTTRKSIEQQFAENRQLLQTTLDSIGDAVITTDMNGCIRWLNPIAERMTGWTKEEAQGRSLAQVFVIVNDETRTAAIDPVEACISQGKIVGMASGTTLLSRDGSEYGIEDSASPIQDANGQLFGVVLVFHDVSEQRRLSREMTHRATHDPLTGLVNRAEFETRLQRALSASHDEDRSNALLFIDLDQFKVVNDACGHTVGDQLLLQISTMLRDAVRSRDTVARLGGDEFGIVLEHCSMEQAQRIAQKMCDQMEQFRFVHDGRRFLVGTSIGLVPLDRRWDSVAPALQAADASCYAAKEAGRNRVHVWADADNAIASRHGEMQWVSRIGQALDDNRFELYGQRIEAIDARQTKLHLEVLLRMRDADGSIIAPGAFLPAAERFNLVTRIDRWVVREVFKRLTDDSELAEQVGVISINLSGHSVGDRVFHRDLTRMIHDARFDVRKLCFEITETAAVTNFVDAKKFIDEVRALGVKVALDDFGAGASSFGYLKSLPVDYLKIDGQFITNLLDDALNDAAVRCFRDVARAVGVLTIAEFVETEAVRQVLCDIGIDLAQGYLFHRPEPLAILISNLLEAA